MKKTVNLFTNSLECEAKWTVCVECEAKWTVCASKTALLSYVFMISCGFDPKLHVKRL